METEEVARLPSWIEGNIALSSPVCKTAIARSVFDSSGGMQTCVTSMLPVSPHFTSTVVG